MLVISETWIAVLSLLIVFRMFHTAFINNSCNTMKRNSCNMAWRSVGKITPERQRWPMSTDGRISTPMAGSPMARLNRPEWVLMPMTARPPNTCICCPWRQLFGILTFQRLSLLCGEEVWVYRRCNKSVKWPRWKICLIVIKSWPQHYFDDTGPSSVSMECTGQSRQSQKEIYFALSWERHTDHQVHMEYLPLNCQIALKWQTRKGKIKVGNYKPGSFFLIIAKC